MAAETIMIVEEDENQFLLFLRNSFFNIFDFVFQHTILAIHYFFLPVVFLYSFWMYAFDQTWQMSRSIVKEIHHLLMIIPLTVELWFWSGMILLETVFLMKKVEEVGVEVEQRIYRRIKTILNIFNALPLTRMNAASLYSALERLNIFGKALPFPHFLFDQTFTSIDFGRGVVRMAVPSTEEEEPSTSDPQAAEKDEQSSSNAGKITFIQRKPSIKTDKSDQSKSTDLSTSESSESSVSTGAASISI